MILHTYVSTHNDLWMMRHYVRYYGQFASKIFVYDDESKDGTREFLESCAPLVEIKSPGFQGIDDLKLQELRSHEYRKHSRGVADWVIIGDSDEFHYHPQMAEALEEQKSKSVVGIVSHGWQMMADRPPDGDVLLTDALKEGLPDTGYSRVIFNPELDIIQGIGHHAWTIEDGQSLNFHPTRKKANKIPDPAPKKIYPLETSDQNFKMLHFKYIGVDYIRDRHARIWARLSDHNKRVGWGHHNSPDWHHEYSAEWYLRKLKDRIKVID